MHAASGRTIFFLHAAGTDLVTFYKIKNKSLPVGCTENERVYELYPGKSMTVRD